MRKSVTHTSEGVRVLHQYFDGVSDAVRHYESVPRHMMLSENANNSGFAVGEIYPNGRFKRNKSGRGRQIHFSPMTWLGVGSTQEADQYIKEGWPEGVAKMNQALADIGNEMPKPESVRRRRVRGSFGDSVDMGAVWSGSFDTAFTHTKRRNVDAPQNVTIAIPLGASWNVLSDDLFWRGAACIKLADLLTEAGFNVRIVAYRSSLKAFKSGAGIYQEVEIKQHDTPMDIDALASCLSMAAFFRHVLFKCQCVEAELVADNLGTPVTPEEFELVRDETFTDPSEIDGSDAAVAWIQQQLNRVNNKSMGHQ